MSKADLKRSLEAELLKIERQGGKIYGVGETRYDLMIRDVLNYIDNSIEMQDKANKYDSLVKKIEKELEEKEQLRENYWERNTIRLHFIEENKQAEISEEELEINDKHMQLDGEIKKLKELMIFYKNY